MVKNGGWIKLSRKLLDWKWFQDKNVLIVWIYLLLNASKEEFELKGQTYGTGVVITTTKKISEATGLSVQEVRTAIKKLSTNEITNKSTNEFSIITILKFSEFQTRRNTPSTNKSTSKSTTIQEDIENIQQQRACEEFEMNELWAEDVARFVYEETKHKVKLEYEDVVRYYERFNLQERARGNNETEREYRFHFSDWIRIIIKKELKDESDRQSHRTEAERYEDSADLVRKYASMCD